MVVFSDPIPYRSEREMVMKVKVMHRCPVCKVLVGSRMRGDLRVLTRKGHPECVGAMSASAYLQAEWVNVPVEG